MKVGPRRRSGAWFGRSDTGGPGRDDQVGSEARNGRQVPTRTTAPTRGGTWRPPRHGPVNADRRTPGVRQGARVRARRPRVIRRHGQPVAVRQRAPSVDYRSAHGPQAYRRATSPDATTGRHCGPLTTDDTSLARFDQRMSQPLDRRAPAPRRGASDPGSHWRRWGPYVTERAWGTVREDYSADGDAWEYFPHDHARAALTAGARTGWQGSAISYQTLCLALACGTGTTRS